MVSQLIDRPFIRNPFISKMIDLFDALRFQKVNFGVPSCALVTGESGSGKSELAKHYIKNKAMS